MTAATLYEIQQAMATQITTEIGDTVVTGDDELQVTPLRNPNPTPPAIDIYLDDPSGEAISFGTGKDELHFVIRARVATTDNDGQQILLLSLMDGRADTSLAGALESDTTLGGKVDDLVVTGPSGVGVFANDLDARASTMYLGCTWQVRVLQS